jgi:hypothetical protein
VLSREWWNGMIVVIIVCYYRSFLHFQEGKGQQNIA